MDGKQDSERYLTSLGLEQAKITGARLGKIKVKWLDSKEEYLKIL